MARRKARKKNSFMNSFIGKVKGSSFQRSKKDFFQKSTFSMFEVIILLLIAIIFGVLIGFLITYRRNPLDKNVSEMVSTYHNILDNYYDEVEADKLADAAIKGMVDSLRDPYSSYMNENSTNQFQDTVNGSFVGIGVTVQYEESGYHRIIDLIENGPADKAGIKKDDIIVEINGKNVSQLQGDKFTKLVRGKKGTKVKIKVKRGDEEKIFSVKRDTIEMDSVAFETLVMDKERIGYIQISSFASNTYAQFSNALKKLEKKKIQSLVIDVRDNPGGYLVQTQEILSMFFPKKTLLYQIESKKDKKKVLSLTKEARDYPVAVLINGSSASASEVLASCFQEKYEKSVIVGEKSYGKGTVQRPKYLSDGTSLKFTSQKWLTSKGKYIEGKGITPDVQVEQGKEYYDNPSHDTDVQLQEAIKRIKESN